ncbi:MAG: hypothetical protein N2378_08585 [Chloroflexaceae bacterium]|nr:hypothetical protein [Chloroflexaceae bacterium]
MRHLRVRASAGIALLLWGIYLLTASGHFYAIDEVQMYSLTEALGTRGTFVLYDPGTGERPVYSKYGPGQSIAALPLYWLGTLVSQGIPPEGRPWLRGAITFWFNPLVTALTAALVYHAGRRIAGHGPALVAALSFGLGTMAWPYTQTFFAEPLQALLWLGAVALIWRPDGSPASTRAYLLSGLLAGLGPAVKIQAGIGLPIIGLFALWSAYRARRLWTLTLAWGLGVALPLAALALYHTALFGSPLRTGYGDEGRAGFVTPFWEGFSGQLWGLRRGLIWSNPLILLALPGLVALWRRDRSLALVCAALAGAQVVFHASWYAWEGGGAWGPRFLPPILPLLCLPLAALWSVPRSRARWLYVPTAILAVFTLAVQAGALGVNMNQWFGARQPPAQVFAHLNATGEGLTRLYERHLAPGRVVLLRGFAPSEGADEAQFPRWTTGDARIRVRPSGAPVTLTVAATTCLVTTGPPPLTLVIGEVRIADTPCPGRVYRVPLPPVTTEVRLVSPTWRPVSVGIPRDEDLGVYVNWIEASSGTHRLPLVGDRLPLDPVSLHPGVLRWRLSDWRIPVWDFWWAYLPLSTLPPASVQAIMAAWGGLALASIVTGLWLLTRDPT